MSEIIERVALAIGSELDDIYSSAIPLRQLKRVARAAIEAMREPTAEMLFVGSNDEAGFTERNLLESWHLMIDEALALPQAQGGSE